MRPTAVLGFALFVAVLVSVAAQNCQCVPTPSRYPPGGVPGTAGCLGLCGVPCLNPSANPNCAVCDIPDVLHADGTCKIPGPASACEMQNSQSGNTTTYFCGPGFSVPACKTPACKVDPSSPNRCKSKAGPFDPYSDDCARMCAPSTTQYPKCLACQAGYNLDQTFKCVAGIQPPNACQSSVKYCATCDQLNTGVCTSCVAGRTPEYKNKIISSCNTPAYTACLLKCGAQLAQCMMQCATSPNKQNCMKMCNYNPVYQHCTQVCGQFNQISMEVVEEMDSLQV